MRPEAKPEARLEPSPDARPPAPTTVPVPAGPSRPQGAAPASGPANLAPLPTAPKLAKGDEDAALRRFITEIQRRLGKEISPQRDYPPQAREQGWQGSSKLRLSIGSDGKLKEVVVVDSSGHESLDQVALGKVQAMSLPRIPSEMRARAFSVEVVVKFAVRQ